MDNNPLPSGRRQALKGVAAAAGVVAGVAAGAVLGVMLRIAAAVARGALRRPQREPAEHPSRRAPAAPRPGWNTAQPQQLVKPTYWPIVLALGIALLLWGLTSTLIISCIGVAFFFLALINWIGLLLHER